MAAVDRLRSSLKRVNSCGRRSRASTPASSNGQDINVDEELAKLQPSVCLLDFYRQKIATFGERQQEMLQLLEKYQQTTKPTFLEEERRQLTSELIELRSALSDVNVFIHAERQQVVRLYSENERLKLDNLEAEKKVALLLSLCGLSEGELKVFLRDPCRTTIIKQKLPPHLKKIHIKLKEDFQETGESEATLALKACIKSLETQLEESDKTWRRERNAFIQDRSLLASESRAQAAKDEAHIKLLTARLEEAERLLSETVEDALRKSADVQKLEMTWLAERDHLLSVLSTVQENMPLVTQIQTIGRTGSYTDLSKMKSTCELKDLRREIESIKREASEAEELRTMYESQCLQLEQKMCKLREQKEAAMQIYKERNQKLLQQIEMLKQDKIRLGERRRTDIKGFQADIRLLKNDVKTVVHQLFKITITLSGADNLPVDISALSEMQAVAALVRTVQNAVAETKRKILKLENEMNNPLD